METLSYYCSNSTALSLLGRAKIWLTDLSRSNDALEGDWALRRYVEKVDNNKRDVVRAILQTFLCQQLPLGICFSEEEDLLSQWRGYASDGKGCCIHFDPDKLRQLEDFDVGGSRLSDGIRLRKVIYGRLEYSSEQFVKELYDAFQDVFSNASENSGGVSFACEVEPRKWKAIAKFFEFKNPAFAEEREWRLFVVQSATSYSNLQFKAGADKIFPHLEIPFPKDAIVGITLGPKNGTRFEAMKALLAAHGYEQNVWVHKSTASYR